MLFELNVLPYFGKLYLSMENQQSHRSKYESVKNFLFKPMIRTDSNFFKYSGLGVQLSVTIIVFLFAGLWLDKYFETKFIFTLVFVFLGFVGVFYKIFAVLKELDEEKKQKTDDGNKE